MAFGFWLLAFGFWLLAFGLEFCFTVSSFGFRDLIVGFRVWGLGFCFNVRGFGLGIWDWILG